jgi:hypothetical protein
MEKKKKKKKRTSGQHVAKRRPIQFPVEWIEVAQELAGRRPSPVMWLMVELLKKEAEAQGIKDLPPEPWKAK